MHLVVLPFPGVLVLPGEAGISRSSPSASRRRKPARRWLSLVPVQQLGVPVCLCGRVWMRACPAECSLCEGGFVCVERAHGTIGAAWAASGHGVGRTQR